MLQKSCKSNGFLKMGRLTVGMCRCLEHMLHDFYAETHSFCFRDLRSIKTPRSKEAPVQQDDGGRGALASDSFRENKCKIARGSLRPATNNSSYPLE